MRTLIVDDGSALANALASSFDTTRFETTRTPMTNVDPSALAKQCHSAQAAVFVADSWEARATTYAGTVLDRVVEALRGSGKKLLYISESTVIGDTSDSFGNEDSPTSTRSPHPWHNAAEAAVLRAVSMGVHSVVVRRTLVHGNGAGSLLQGLIARARWADEAVFIGSGSSATSTVHVDDLSRLIQASLLRAPEAAIYMAASEEVLTWKDIADLIAHTNDPVSNLRSLSVRDAAVLGLDGATMAINNVIVDNGPRRRLGWLAAGPTLAAGLVPVPRAGQGPGAAPIGTRH